MATIKIDVSNRKRADKTYQVRIRLIHKRKVAYIPTIYVVNKKQINRNFELIDTDLLSELNGRIEKYYKKLISLGIKADDMYVKELAIALAKEETTKNLIELFETRIENLKYVRSKHTIDVYRTAMKTFKAFLKSDYLSPESFTVKLLNDFETYLRVTANDIHKGKKLKSNSTIALYMAYLKALTRNVIDEYNTEDETLIKFNPFSRYKRPANDVPRKRNLDIQSIREIKNIVLSDKLEMLSRDVFMISFYACGMNMVDLYHIKKLNRGRLEYERTKTRNKRKDKAFISIAVQPELAELIKKYKGKENLFDFRERYSTHDLLMQSVNIGLARIGKKLGLETKLTTYYARHSWATIARNDLGISKDDIHMALNHSSQDITDTYIKTDWAIIDRANRKVINFLYQT